MEAEELRKKHQQLTYRNYDIERRGDDLVIINHFELSPGINFSPQVIIKNVSQQQLSRLSQEEINLYAFHLGMAEIFSYWKCAIPQEVVIEAGFLSDQQLAFWHQLLISGMGEFFYVNQINFTDKDFVKLSCNFEKELAETTPAALEATNENKNGGVLVPLGGGKDSLVTLEVLLQNQAHPEEKIVLFSLNPTPSVQKTFADFPNLKNITAQRAIDPSLLELNKQGYLNGHTPISSYIAILSTFISRLNGLEYIAVSNERSSNEASVSYLGIDVNHQYSKSYHFEQSFQDYAKTYLSSDAQNYQAPLYFSFLRPLYELQIGRIFAKNGLYFNDFKSCNKNQRQDSWCGNCSKCLFAYMILSPFIDQDQLIGMFGSDIFANEDLWSTTLDLIGYTEQKPLDCVGTKEESLVSLYLSYQKVKNDNKTLSYILKQFESKILPKEQNLAQRASKILTAWNSEHSLPPQFARILEDVQHNFK